MKVKEILTELSKGKLDNYIEKSGNDLDKRHERKRVLGFSTRSNERRINNRTKGFNAAMLKSSTKGALGEAWDEPAETNPEKKGMFDGKTVTQLQHELNALLKAGPHPKDSPGFTKVKELEFAIRAKKAKGGKWGGVMHDNKKADEEDCAMTMEAFGRPLLSRMFPNAAPNYHVTVRGMRPSENMINWCRQNGIKIKYGSENEVGFFARPEKLENMMRQFKEMFPRGPAPVAEGTK